MPIHGYPGNVITANPTAPTSSVASGVWTTEQQLIAKAAGNWPFTIPTQQISRSLRFNSADSAYLNRTFGTPTDGKKYTYSGWVKRLDSNGLLLLCEQSNNIEYIQIGPADTVAGTGNILSWRFGDASGPNVKTTAVYRDVSAWYHVVVAYDSTQATASNRIKLYVNGSQVTDLTASYPAQNTNSSLNRNGADVRINSYTGTYIGNGYMTEINFIDGQALTPSSFGQTNASTGVWEPIAYSGTYGTNGFYLNFSDNSGTTSTTLGKDYSGNGNNWTPNNFSVTAGAGNDSLVDSPTPYGTDTGVGGEVRGNYATLNPLASNGTLSNGNLDYSMGNTKAVATMAMTSGKWYTEVTVNTTSNGLFVIGVGKVNTALNIFSLGVGYYADNGNKYVDGTSTSYGATYTAGDVIGVAVNFDSNEVTFYKNNTSQGAISLPSSTDGYVLVLQAASGSTSATFSTNFGQRPFAYTAPSGFKALCTTNLPTPTIGATSTTQANDYFNVVLYSGNGSTQSITGVGFQPDSVWIKDRTGTGSHNITDAVRGVTKTIYPNETTAETTLANGLTAFNSDGFSIGANGDLNNSVRTYVAWNWKANGAGSSNTAGTITSTVSANTTSGFSIVTYTGTGANATVGHGLGVAPNMIIIKSRSLAGENWIVGHTSLGFSNQLNLNTTAASAASTNFNSTTPTSSVFSIGSGTAVNSNTNTYVAYCFAPVAGYSAFGSFTGNGSTDGPFVFLGFRPRWILIKNASAAEPWNLVDTSRDPYNVMANYLQPNSSGAEGSITFLDGLSNGFKLRSSAAAFNGSGNTMIYACFAENPFKYSLAR